MEPSPQHLPNGASAPAAAHVGTCRAQVVDANGTTADAFDADRLAPLLHRIASGEDPPLVQVRA